MSRTTNTELIREANNLKRQGLTHEKTAGRLDRSVRTVGNWVSPSWLEKRGLGYLLYSDAPLTNIQKEAERLCRLKQHDWLKNPLFEYHAYKQVLLTEHPIDRVTQGASRTGQTIRETTRITTENQCLFCGEKYLVRKQFFSIN